MSRRLQITAGLLGVSGVGLLVAGLVGLKDGGLSLAAGSTTPDLALSTLLISCLTAACSVALAASGRLRIPMWIGVLFLSLSAAGLWIAQNSAPVGSPMPLG